MEALILFLYKLALMTIVFFLLKVIYSTESALFISALGLLYLVYRTMINPD
mgnify:CR=1 FL=1